MRWFIWLKRRRGRHEEAVEGDIKVGKKRHYGGDYFGNLKI